MTLTTFARLLGTSPKWVLNTMRALGRTPRYTTSMARQLTVTRAIHDSVCLPLSTSFSLARTALRSWNGELSPVTLRVNAADDVALTIDVYRLLASLHVRQAELRESYAPPVRGRPRTTPVDALVAAADWGLDLSLVHDNMRKTPHERLRQLDAMRAFAAGVRRSPHRAGPTDV